MKNLNTAYESKELCFNGIPTNYIISNRGDIINKDKHFMRPHIVKGRPYATITIQGQTCFRRLDYLVAENFKPVPEQPIRLIHVDDDKYNCHVDNLIWLTKNDIIEKYKTEYHLDEDIALEEAWKPIDTPMGLIEISSFGDTRWPDSNESIQQYSSHGYQVIYYTIPEGTDRETKMLLVHRLVAEAFIPNPNNYDIVNHLDADKSNCHVWNLEWCDISMNTEHAFLHECVSRYSDEQIHSVCRLLVDNKLSHVHIAQITGVDRKTISDIYRGRRHKDVIEQYKFPAKKWSEELELKVIDLVNQGFKGKEVLNKLNLPINQSSVSFYERARRKHKILITL